MATQINWTPRAQKDLIQIFEYLAQDSPTYAAHFISELVFKVDKQLQIFPLSGRIIPELELSPINYLREIIFKSYRVVYNPNNLPKSINVISVQSSRMDILGQAESWIL